MVVNYADERKRLAERLKQYHDGKFTPGVYDHSIFGLAAKLLEVDAVEVVHGRTEAIEPFEVTLTVRCCLCGAAMGNLDNYCPNCGAKMDGERKDNG